MQDAKPAKQADTNKGAPIGAPAFKGFDLKELAALSADELGEVIADVVEDSTRSRARQEYEMHKGLLRVCSRLERIRTKNYGVPLREG